MFLLVVVVLVAQHVIYCSVRQFFNVLIIHSLVGLRKKTIIEIQTVYYAASHKIRAVRIYKNESIRNGEAKLQEIANDFV